VAIDLTAGTATGVGGTIRNISDLTGGAGNDTLTGGDGSDTFLFTFGGGVTADSVIGDGGPGGSGSWLDVIAISGLGHDPGQLSLAFSAGGITGSSSGQYDLQAGSAGTITLTDGSTLLFSGLERITY
jgi:serralysin